MILAIWIGLLHITLGRVFGMINHARQDHGDHRTKAVMANFGWLLVMWGILMIIWSIIQMPYMPDFTTLPPVVMILNMTAIVGAVMLVVGVLFIARDSGLELVELPTIISHVLSYTRIVAVGLSSVAIAMVVNYIAIGMLIDPQLENITLVGVLFIIMGVAVFLVGHTLNTALGVIGGGLHSIRLHYVEYFTKFYKGGGKKYNPFGFNRRFTED
jgi:V/A-type H+-transporting ATPase subunit I